MSELRRSTAVKPMDPLGTGVPKIVDLVGCARCHGPGHHGLKFVKLRRPVVQDYGVEDFTHWATCPNTGEPILLKIEVTEPKPALPCCVKCGRGLNGYHHSGHDKGLCRYCDGEAEGSM